MTSPNLFNKFAGTVAVASTSEIAADISLSGRLTLEQEAGYTVNYAPFDHVSSAARIVIVGITPGRRQAANALSVAAEALRAGRPPAEAARAAKAHASFSGPMRGNLVAMLDHFGVAAKLGLHSTAELFIEGSELAHFTSALRYPVFWNGENYSGSPSMLKSPLLTRHLVAYAGAELASVKNAVILPLGARVAEAMRFLAARGLIEKDRILEGVEHPSPANNERIAYLLGRKPRAALSSKTNADRIDHDRATFIRGVAAWCPRPSLPDILTSHQTAVSLEGVQQ